MTIGIRICLCIFVLDLTPPLIHCQAAVEFCGHPQSCAAMEY